MLKPTWIGSAVAIILLLAANLSFVVTPASAAEEELVIIAATSFPENDVPFATLKELFKGRASTLNGRRLIPINHPIDAGVRQAFDLRVLRLKPDQVGRFWIDAKIRDDGRPPTTAGTSELVLRIVASLRNSVSYATRSMLAPQVKVLTIDGKSASDPGYALKP